MEVVTAALQLMRTRQDFFLKLLGEHLWISFTAISIAMVLGLVIGILVSEFHLIAKPSIGLINLLYTIPSISLLGFLIPFSGIGNTTAIIALTIYALLPMVRNTYTGITTVNPIMVPTDNCGWLNGHGFGHFDVFTNVDTRGNFLISWHA